LANTIGLNGIFGGSRSIEFSNLISRPTGSGAAGTFTNNIAAGKQLIFNDVKAITTAGATGTNAVTFAGAGETLVKGQVSNGSNGTALTKSDAGTLRLSGSNTYTGLTTVSGGVLLLENANALPGGIGSTGGISALTISGGVIGLGNGDFTRAIGSGTNQVRISTSGGFAAYNANRTVNLGGASGAATWGDTNFMSASGTFILGASSATHMVDFQNPIALGNPARTVQVNRGSGDVDARLSGVLSSTSGTGGLIKTGNGVLELTGVNTFSGTLAVQNGTVSVSSINAAGSDGPLGRGAVVLGSSGNTGTLAYTGATVTSSRAFTIATGGTAGFSVTNPAATLTLSAALGGSGAASFGGPGSFVLSGGVSVGDLFKTGTGALTLAVGNSQANTTVSEGQLNVNHLAALGTPAGTLTMAAGTRLDNTSGATVTITNPKSIALGSSLTFVGSNDLDLGTGNVTLAGNTEFEILAKELTLSGDVFGAGFGITKTGAGTLRLDGLSGASSFTGNSFVNAGTLLIEGSSVLGGGTSTVVTVADGAFLQIGASAGLGNVTVVSRPGGLITASVVNANQTFDQSGTLTASNGNFNGVQTIESGVTITASHDWLGTVPATPTAGRIVFQNNARIRVTEGFELAEKKGINLASGTAIFESDANQAFLVPSSVAGLGGIRKVGAGNVRLTGSNSYSGGTVIEEGIVGISYGESLGDVSGRLKLDGGEINAAQVLSGALISSVTIDSARQFVLGNGKTSGINAQTGLTLRYDGVITEENGAGAAAGLRFGSSAARQGTVILGGANTYRGDTTISFGTLKLASGGSFANSPRIIVGDAASSGVILDLTEKSSFSIGANQTLMGKGTVVLGANTNLTVEGMFSPGNSPGLFTYDGGSTTLSGTTLMEIWGTERGANPGYDAVNVTNSGLLTLGGMLELNFNQNFLDTDSFTLFDTLTGGLLAGGFTGITITGSNNDYTGLSFTQAGNVWTTGFNANNQGLRVTQTASNVTVNVIVVPEPGTLALAGIGIAAAAYAYRRRRS
jgi:autotransporter-associated beta strand protein